MPVGAPDVAPGSLWSIKSTEGFTSSAGAAAGKGVCDFRGVQSGSVSSQVKEVLPNKGFMLESFVLLHTSPPRHTFCLPESSLLNSLEHFT